MTELRAIFAALKVFATAQDVSKILEGNLALQNRARRRRADNIFKSFRRYAKIMRHLKNIAEQYSDIAQTHSIGKSYEGRDLLGLKISSGAGEKPVVIIDAGIHARKWIAPTTAIYVIQQLVENSTNHHLFDDGDIYVIPSLNPDGYEFSHKNIEYILHPWGFSRTPPKTAKQLKCVAEAAAAELFKHRQTKYKIGSTIELLYAASGSSMDWAMAEARAETSYTMELPGGKHGFAPPPSQIIPVGRETFDALAVFIKYAKDSQIC